MLDVKVLVVDAVPVCRGCGGDNFKLRDGAVSQRLADAVGCGGGFGGQQLIGREAGASHGLAKPIGSWGGLPGLKLAAAAIDKVLAQAVAGGGGLGNLKLIRIACSCSDSDPSARPGWPRGEFCSHPCILVCAPSSVSHSRSEVADGACTSIWPLMHGGECGAHSKRGVRYCPGPHCTLLGRQRRSLVGLGSRTWTWQGSPSGDWGYRQQQWNCFCSSRRLPRWFGMPARTGCRRHRWMRRGATPNSASTHRRNRSCPAGPPQSTRR